MANQAARNKQEIIKSIAPIGLVPLATGIAFLTLGSRGVNSCPGHPSLPTFLLFAGTLTIGLGLMTKLGSYIVIQCLPSNRAFTPEEEHVKWILYHLKHFLSISQVILLVAGTIIVAPLASRVHPWDFKNPDAKYYCDYGTVVFSAIFFPSMWILLCLALIGYILITCSRMREGSQDDVSI